MHKKLQLMVMATLLGFFSLNASADDISSIGPRPLSGAQLAQWSDSEGFKRGIASANVKILRGELVFRSHGLALKPTSQREYQQRRDAILAAYNISFSGKGCMGDQAGEDSGYNHRMAQEVLSLYGDDFWRRVDQKARDGT